MWSHTRRLSSKHSATSRLGDINLCTHRKKNIEAKLSSWRVEATVRTKKSKKKLDCAQTLSNTLLSSDMLSGMVRTMSYPSAAATIAHAMPVFPLVGSTRVVTPGLICPRFSASLIMLCMYLRFRVQRGVQWATPNAGGKAVRQQRERITGWS